jgi:hypothetical protein
VDLKIILRLGINKYNGLTWIGFIWFRIRKSGGSYEHGNEIFSSTI